LCVLVQIHSGRRATSFHVLSLSWICARVKTQAKEDTMWISLTAFAVVESVILWVGIRNEIRKARHSS